MDPHRRAPKKNTSHGNEVLPQDTTHLISYKDHVTNKEVRAKIQQAIGPHEDLLTIVNRRKLQWYGHVSRSSGLAKTILQWKGEEDKADKGRGGKTTSGTGQAWSSASPRGQWRTGKQRKLIAKLSVVPQRPSRLRDWWWWWWWYYVMLTNSTLASSCCKNSADNLLSVWVLATLLDLNIRLRARPLPCLHILQEGLRQGFACSFVGNHVEVQHQHRPYSCHQKRLWQGR